MENSLDNFFPKDLRLLRSNDFKRVHESGRRKSSQTLQIFYIPNYSENSRFGISVSKKFGLAVERNLLKRWIREAIRKNKTLIQGGLDVVVHPRLNVESSSKQILLELNDLFISLNLRKEIALHKKIHPA